MSRQRGGVGEEPKHRCRLRSRDALHDRLQQTRLSHPTRRYEQGQWPRRRDGLKESILFEFAPVKAPAVAKGLLAAVIGPEEIFGGKPWTRFGPPQERLTLPGPVEVDQLLLIMHRQAADDA